MEINANHGQLYKHTGVSVIVRIRVLPTNQITLTKSEALVDRCVVHRP